MRAHKLWGSRGGPGGGLGAGTRPGGGPFWALGGPKSIEKPLVLCVFEPQRGPRRAPRTDAKNCKMDSVGRLKPRGPKWSGPGARDPPGALSGRPKSPRHIGRNGFWKPPTSKCLVSLRKYNVLQKSQKSSRGHWDVVLHEFSGAPGGPSPPPGYLRRFLGGVWSPAGLRSENPGGGQGGPGRPFCAPGGPFR